MTGGEGGLGTSCTPCKPCDCGQTPVLCSSDVPSENRTNSKMGTSWTQALHTAVCPRCFLNGALLFLESRYNPFRVKVRDSGHSAQQPEF